MVARFTRRHTSFVVIATVFATALLASCTASATPFPPTATPQVVSAPLDQNTSTVAPTIIVQRQIPTAPPSPTPLVEPSSAPVLPTATLSGVGPGGCILQAQFIADVTIPDGSVITPGAAFVKTWRVKNNGTCTWTSDYQVVFDSGQSMNGIAPVSLSPTSTGNTVDISINLVAPTEPGNYTGRWRLVSSNAAVFSSLTVVIIATAPTPTPTPALTPTLTLTPSANPGLSSELFFGPAGTPSPPCGDEPASLPAVQLASRLGDTTSLCLWGFPMDQPITLTLTAPDNGVYTGIPAQVDKGSAFIRVRLWLPAGLLHRGWQVTAEVGQIVTKSKFDLPQLGSGKLSAYPSNAWDPLALADELRTGLACPHYGPGQSVHIAGEGFQPNQSMAIGVYYAAGYAGYPLIRSQNVAADSSGHVQTSLITASSDSAGYYVVYSNVSASPSGTSGEVACYRIQ